jgi:alpha-galactosidase
MAGPVCEGSRPDGSGFAPQFTATEYTMTEHGDGAQSLKADCVDEIAELGLEVMITLSHTVEIEAEITNRGSTPYRLDALRVTVPVADHAAEILRFSGHWIREFDTERVDWARGAVSIENRRGSHLS